MKKIIILVMLVTGSMFVGCNNKNYEVIKNQEVQETTQNTEIEKEELTFFEEFENALSNNNFEYEKVTMASEFIGAKEGYKYKLTSGEKVEIYRFDEDSETFSEVKENKSVYLDGVGSFPVEINNNFVLLMDETESKSKILDIFINLSI